DVQPPERHQVAVFQGVGPADTKRQAVDVRAVRAAQVHHKELVAAGAQHDMPPAYAVIVAAPGADVHVEPVVRLAVRANHHIPPDLQRHGPARHADGGEDHAPVPATGALDRKSTRLNSSHVKISYAVIALKKKMSSSGT